MGAVIMQEGKPFDFLISKNIKSANKLHNYIKGTPKHCGKSQRFLNHPLGTGNRSVNRP